MFFASSGDGRRVPLELSGLGSSADVQSMQLALANLATVTGRPAINPGPATGIVDDGTMTGIVNGIDLLTKQLPQQAYAILQGAISVSAYSTSAKNIAGQYAATITGAANLAAHEYLADQAQASATVQLQPINWYKKPSGIAVLLGIAFLGFKLVFSKNAG